MIDAHEHLAPEKERTDKTIGLPVLFAWPYTGTDLVSAGLSPKSIRGRRFLNDLADINIPLRERWEIMSPYLQKIRYGSYARAIFISVKEFYGFSDINDDNYLQISEAMAKANTPGIYHRILRERCNIRSALTQAGRTDYDLDLLIPLMPGNVITPTAGGRIIQRSIRRLFFPLLIIRGRSQEFY